MRKKKPTSIYGCNAKLLPAQNLEHYSYSNNDEIVMVHEKNKSTSSSSCSERLLPSQKFEPRSDSMKKYQCLQCNARFTQIDNMLGHVESVHKISVSNVPIKDEQKCESCNEIINQSSIKKHVKNCKIYLKFSKITSTGFKCLVCYEGQYTKRKDMNFHIREVHSDLYQEELEK